MLKLAVCDDDKAVCEWLRQKLLYYGETCGESLEIYCYLSENALLETLEENQFDIIFLDIQLEKSNGIQIGEEIRKKQHGRTIRITYISTFREYAMQLFHIHPFDFLIKPLKEEDVYHVMDELCACIDSERQIFEYRNSEGMHRIAYREIMYFYSTEKTIHMVTEQGENEFRGQISDVEKRTGDYFLKIHKSFLSTGHMWNVTDTIWSE